MDNHFNMYQLADQRRADMIREAEQRHAQAALALTSRRPALARLGKLLSQAGDSLQERYGERVNNLS